jgi:serine O-acetyltransferase
MSLLATLARDAARYQKLGGIRRNLGFWMGATHRLQEYARTAHPMLRVPVQAACQAASVLWRTVWGVQISEQAKIGPGLCLIHPRDVRVGPCTIGRDCLIFHEVTIASEKAGLRIGDGVDLYVGARLLGPLTVGDDAKIGANCVVATDVAPGSDLVTARNRVVSPELVVAFGPRH